MGRGRKRKTRLEKRLNAEHTRGAGASPGASANATPKLMDSVDLEDVWRGVQCDHQNAVAGLYGKCATVVCDGCSTSMSFLLRFGRPKTFDVLMREGYSDRHVGHASVSGSREFIRAASSSILLPEGGADPEGGMPERDRMMLGMLVKILNPDGIHETAAAAKGDFVKEWRSIDGRRRRAWRSATCKHRMVSCQASGDQIGLTCSDCAATLMFEHAGHGMFGVSIARMPLEPVQYGLHGADAVVDMIREYADTLALPWPMADMMSDDPDRDARDMWKMVSLLERRGLLERVNTRESPHSRMVQTLSAASCGRSDFERWVEPMSVALRSQNVKLMERGKTVTARRALEAMRLTWPHWYEGVGVDVEAYDPSGTSQHCVRCGFSTLDDDDIGPDHWERGCPECGYGGYLLDMDKGQAGAAPGIAAHAGARDQ